MTKNLRTFLTLLFKAIIRLFLFLGLFAAFVLFLTRFVFLMYAAPRTFTLVEVPKDRIAIVFGAGLLRDGSAGPVLSDRVETAVRLYQAGKVDKLLMSGDNRFVEYNEPEAMRKYALQAGVPDEDIVLDYAGRRTYDTCYRAHEIFQVKSAILVTQPFHMARALYLCNSFGIQSTGVETDNKYFRKISRLIWNTRELLATMGAAWDVMYIHPLPVLGQPEPIF
jgi:SanA protein